MNIDFIHGDHLVKAPTFIDLHAESLLSFQEILKLYPQAERLKLTQLAQQSVYQFTFYGKSHLVSATTGESLLHFLDHNQSDHVNSRWIITMATFATLLSFSGLFGLVNSHY